MTLIHSLPIIQVYNLLYIANCGHPALMPVCTLSCSADSIPRVVGYDDIIPVEGSTITFSCPPGLELVGPNSATCSRNGEWGPDLSGLMCNDSVRGQFFYSRHITTT